MNEERATNLAEVGRELAVGMLQQANLKLGIRADTTDPRELEVLMNVATFAVAYAEALIKVGLIPTERANLRATLQVLSDKLTEQMAQKAPEKE